MADQALREAYMRISHALTCDGNKQYQEAYQGYLATTTYITNVLGHRSTGPVWCDESSQKLIALAKNCIEAASRIVETVINQNAQSTEQGPTERDSVQPGPLATSAPRAQPATIPPPPPQPIEDDDNDILSILDSLPEVPANRPGRKYKPSVKRSSTALPPPVVQNLSDLANLPMTNSATLPPNTSGFNIPMSPTSSHSLPRNLPSSPQPLANTPKRISSTRITPVRNETTYFSSPLGTNLGGTGSNPIVLKVSPLDRAKQQNTVLAARYDRRAQRGMGRRQDKLELIRAQEENLMIANELEKTLSRKAALRKQRLEQEQAEVPGETVDSFEGVLCCKKPYLEKLFQEISNYDYANGWVNAIWSSVMEENEKMMQFVTRCLRQQDHPLNKVIGEAQYNFYNRLSPLNKKIYLTKREERAALRPGIEAELEFITADVVMFVENFGRVFYKTYPKFNTEEGHTILEREMAKIFYLPIWKSLLELYSFVHSEELTVLRLYCDIHRADAITEYSDIKPKYHLGEDPYRPAITELQSILETSSPLEKLALLTSFGQLVSNTVMQHHLDQGCTQEEAVDIASMGADDLIPITIYIVTRTARPELYVELIALQEITHDQELTGAEGYFLATVLQAMGHLVQKQKQGEQPATSS